MVALFSIGWIGVILLLSSHSRNKEIVNTQKAICLKRTTILCCNVTQLPYLKKWQSLIVPFVLINFRKSLSELEFINYLTIIQWVSTNTDNQWCVCQSAADCKGVNTPAVSSRLKDIITNVMLCILYFKFENNIESNVVITFRYVNTKYPTQRLFVTVDKGVA